MSEIWTLVLKCLVDIGDDVTLFSVDWEKMHLKLSCFNIEALFKPA